MNVGEMGEAVGDVSGWQLRKFEAGSRSLPLGLAVDVCVRTGIDLEILLSPEQMMLVRRLSQCLHRVSQRVAS